MGRSSALCAAAACLCPALAVAQSDVVLLHYEALVTTASVVDDGATKPDTGTTQQLNFDAFGRRFEIALEPNARLRDVTRRLDLGPGVAAYRGTLADGGWARIVTTAQGPTGLVWDGTTLYGIEHGGDSLAGDARPVIFRLDDLYVPPGALGCGTTAAPMSGRHALAALVEEMTPLAAQGASFNLDIGAVADFEFHTTFGTDTEQALLTRLNNVDGIFSEQLGVQISVAEIEVFSSPDDPFTEDDPEALLEELAVYRGATPAQDAQGLTHMFTGRDLVGSTAGIAYLGVVCSTRSPFDPLGRSFGAGLSEGRRGAVLDSLVAAHEIGHNFGAPHDAEAGSACESTPATFLMAPSVSGVDQFSACSIEQMQPEIASASCMTPIGEPDLAVTLDDPDVAVGAGIAVDYGIDVANLGVDPATSVTLAVDVETGLDVLGAEADAGTCAVIAGAVNCTLDDVPGGAARTLTLTLRGTALGEFSVTATASADSDADSGNDTATGRVEIVPVVDLVLSGDALELGVDQSGTVEALVTNDADFAASGVTLSASLSAGLTIDSATFAGAACTISAQTIDCAADTLAAQGTATLLLAVTAVTAGAQQATLDVAAAEDERNGADNSLVVSVQVVAPPAAEEEDGGTGAIAPLWLVAAALGLLARRRRRVD